MCEYEYWHFSTANASGAGILDVIAELGDERDGCVGVLQSLIFFLRQGSGLDHRVGVCAASSIGLLPQRGTVDIHGSVGSDDVGSHHHLPLC